MKIKTRSNLDGAHVHTSIWMGPEGQTLAFVGSVITTIGEAQLLLTALKLGANQMDEHLVTEHEGYLSGRWTTE